MSTGPIPYRLRFRFRVLKPLTIEQSKHQFAIGPHAAELSSRDETVPISKSEWLIINVRGLASLEEATELARRLKIATEISSVASREGIDTGTDLPTSGIGAGIKKEMLDEHGVDVRNNIHGLDIFPDLDNVRFINFAGKASITKAPDPFLSDIGRFVEDSSTLSPPLANVVLLLNFALMRTEPVAQIVFAVSAVEMLGQNLEWSASQKRLLADLAVKAHESAIGSVEEREEVAAAIRSSLHRLSLRQGVMRLLDTLGLPLRTQWDQLYAERSKLVHGAEPQAGADYSSLAFRTVSLCGRILLTAIAQEVPAAAKHVDTFYPLEQT